MFASIARPLLPRGTYGPETGDRIAGYITKPICLEEHWVMPEESELDLDKLHEAIHEEVEHEGGWMLKAIALTTALFAAFAAVAALQAGGTVNEALLLKTEATRLQAEASDQWAAYQAKGIKSAIQQASESVWIAAGKTPPPSLAIERQRYMREQHDLSEVAHAKEHDRDSKELEAGQLLHRH